MTFSEFSNAVIAVLVLLFVANSIMAVSLIRRRNRYAAWGKMGLGISVAGLFAYSFSLVYRNWYAGGLPSVVVSTVALAWVLFVALHIMVGLIMLLREPDG